MAGWEAAAIYSTAPVISLLNTTIASNQITDKSSTMASAITSTGTVELRNSIVDQPTLPGCAGSGTFTSGGYNIIHDKPTGASNPCHGGATDQNVDPKLLVLKVTAPGRTATHALDLSSPARDAIPPNATNQSPSTDQRGAPRPQGTGYDIGAYELDVPSSGLPAWWIIAFVLALMAALGLPRWKKLFRPT